MEDRYKTNRLLLLLGLVLIISGLAALLINPIKSQPILPAKALEQPSTSSAVLGESAQQYKVSRVIDGDTIEIETTTGLKKVRLVGIDTPETVDPRRPVGCFGKEASNETKSLLEGKSVTLDKDISETDKFGRLLRLVYLKLPNSSTLFVNDYLVREGYAKASTYPPDVKFSNQFLEAQRSAQSQNKGLWGKCQ